jgi:hypothetical protein
MNSIYTSSSHLIRNTNKLPISEGRIKLIHHKRQVAAKMPKLLSHKGKKKYKATPPRIPSSAIARVGIIAKVQKKRKIIENRYPQEMSTRHNLSNKANCIE